MEQSRIEQCSGEFCRYFGKKSAKFKIVFENFFFVGISWFIFSLHSILIYIISNNYFTSSQESRTKLNNSSCIRADPNELLEEGDFLMQSLPIIGTYNSNLKVLVYFAILSTLILIRRWYPQVGTYSRQVSNFLFCQQVGRYYLNTTNSV